MPATSLGAWAGCRPLADKSAERSGGCQSRFALRSVRAGELGVGVGGAGARRTTGACRPRARVLYATVACAACGRRLCWDSHARRCALPAATPRQDPLPGAARRGHGTGSVDSAGLLIEDHAVELHHLVCAGEMHRVSLCSRLHTTGGPSTGGPGRRGLQHEWRGTAREADVWEPAASPSSHAESSRGRRRAIGWGTRSARWRTLRRAPRHCLSRASTRRFARAWPCRSPSRGCAMREQCANRLAVSASPRPSLGSRTRPQQAASRAGSGVARP